jgi:hypothetical protein
MKISKRDISIVMVLLGAIALFCVYQFNYRAQVTKAEELQNKITAKTDENKKLLKINEQELKNEMTKWEGEMKAMVKRYPAFYRFDDMIMYLYSLEQVPEYGVHFGEYYMLASATQESYYGKFNEKNVLFGSNDASFNMTFTNATYTGCKKMLASIFQEAEKNKAKNFETITLKFNNITGTVIGSIIVHAYGVSDFSSLGQGLDSNYPHPEVVVPTVSMGVECVFGPTVTPTPEPTPEGQLPMP